MMLTCLPIFVMGNLEVDISAASTISCSYIDLVKLTESGQSFLFREWSEFKTRLKVVQSVPSRKLTDSLA